MLRYFSIVFILLIHLSFTGTGFAQVLKSNPKITNINCVNDGKYAMIYYDLENTNPSDEYYTSIEITHQNGAKINAKTFTGDIKVVKGGLQKKAYWDYKADSIAIKKDILIKIKSTPVPKIPLTKHLAKSVIYPGWGDYKLRDNKLFFGLGVIAYGCLASSVSLNYASYNTYNSYKTTTNLAEVNTLFNKSVSQKKLSYAFLGAAIALWAADLTGIIIKSHKLKNKTTPIENNFYYKQVEQESIFASSDPLFLNTYEAVKAPRLELQELTQKFEDTDENKCLNYKEKAKYKFGIKNLGEGVAINLVAKIEALTNTSGVVFPKEIALGKLNPNEEGRFEIPFEGEENIGTGEAEFRVTVKEANLNDMKPFRIAFQTHAFIAPDVVIADHQFTMEKAGKAELGKVITLKLIVQNIGQGTARNIKAVFEIPPLVDYSNKLDFDKEELQPNERWEISFPFSAKFTYKELVIPVTVRLSESYGKYAKTPNKFELEINQSLETKFEVQADIKKTNIEKASFTSEVDKNIPESKSKNQNRFALIIGNEDYSSFQSGIDKESNVEFAINDAKIFKEYCVKTLGVPERNTTLLTNATVGKMNQEIEILSRLINTTDGKAEVFFYYAGHGFPDENTKDAYIMPVDVSGANVSNGIKLSELYQKLSTYPAAKITIFLDACFSGAGRNKSLAELRGVKIKPKSEVLKGNMLVFTSSSGNESSAPYKDKFHGLFTYFLLKKLQETNGDINYKELSEYLTKTIKQESLLINKKEQNPIILISPDLKNDWENWNLKP